jgi:hypothetical protein
MVLNWTLSDGTTVDSTGRVSGSTSCADTLWFAAKRARSGEYVNSHWGLAPDEERLDFEHPYLVDAWVRYVAKSHGVAVTDAPPVEYPDIADDAPDPDMDPEAVVLN